MGNRLRQVVKTLAVATVVAALPLVSAHGGNGWHHWGHGGGRGLFFFGVSPGYYYPPPPAYYYPPPPVYYVPPPPVYYAPPPVYYGPPTLGLQFNFPLR